MTGAVVLAARHVTFRYGGDDAPALEGVDVDVRAGRTLHVLGANGSGRSTLLAVLAGLAPAATGGTLQGDVRGSPGAALVHADPFLNLSGARDTMRAELAFGLECLGAPRPAMIRRVDDALDAFDLGGLADRDPTTLSGGEAARLAVACQWVLDPTVLLVDEIDAQLDAAGAAAVRRLLADRVAGGGGAVWAGARLAGRAAGDPTGLRGDDAVVLERGRVVAAGRADVVAAQADASDWGVVPRGGPALPQRRGADAAGIPTDDGSGFATDDGAGFATADGAGIAIADEQWRAALEPERPAALDVHGLTCRFDGARAPVLDDVTCRAAPGEVIAVVGPNGGGKSTLLRAIAGLQAKAAGSVAIAGREAGGAVGPARGVALTVQRPERMLFSRTVADEVAVGLRWCGVRADAGAPAIAAALASCGLADRAAEHPHDLLPSERRWLALAAAVALRTPVLVLDEPTAGFDARDLARFARLVARLRGAGRSVLWVTHDHALARALADGAVRLEAGRVAASGRVGDVIGPAAAAPRDVGVRTSTDAPSGSPTDG